MNCKYCNVKLTNDNWSEGLRNKRFYTCKDCHKFRYKRYRKRNPWKVRASYINSRYKSSITENDIIELWESQEGICNICGSELTAIRNCIDHIIPVADGGNTIPENLQWLCEKCNIGKHYWSQDEYIVHCKKVAKKWMEKINEL